MISLPRILAVQQEARRGQRALLGSEVKPIRLAATDHPTLDQSGPLPSP